MKKHISFKNQNIKTIPQLSPNVIFLDLSDNRELKEIQRLENMNI